MAKAVIRTSAIDRAGNLRKFLRWLISNLWLTTAKMRTMMIGKWFLLATTFGLAACSSGLPDYRYKMTVHVITPEGERTYSSVRGVHSEYVSSIMSSSGRTIKDMLWGEAVILDLPNEPTVYALLTRPENPEYATYATGPALGPHIPPSETDSELNSAKGAFLNEIVFRRTAMIALKGAFDLPRTVTRNPSHRTDYQPEQTWPIFVTFGDPTNPASIREVSPEAIGVRNITIEMTDDPVSAQIERKLPWLAEYRQQRKNLKGDSGNVVSSNDLNEVLGTGAFEQGSRERYKQ